MTDPPVRMWEDSFICSFPKLREFCLRQTIISGTMDLLRFLSKHKDTLLVLGLSDLCDDSTEREGWSVFLAVMKSSMSLDSFSLDRLSHGSKLILKNVTS